MKDPVLGMDPGSKGAISMRDELGHHVYLIGGSKIHMAANRIRNYLGEGALGLQAYLFMENVHGQRGDFVNTAFTFGFNTGYAKGVIESQVPLHQTTEVNPQVWQRAFGLGAKYANTTARKNAHKKVAQALCHELKVTLDMADAILIAEFGWRIIYGDLRK